MIEIIVHVFHVVFDPGSPNRSRCVRRANANRGLRARGAWGFTTRAGKEPDLTEKLPIPANRNITLDLELILPTSYPLFWYLGRRYQNK